MSNKRLLFLSENTLCLWNAKEPIPDDVLENGPYKFDVFKDEDEVQMYLASKLSFEDVFAYGAEEGIEVGRVYHRKD